MAEKGIKEKNPNPSKNNNGSCFHISLEISVLANVKNIQYTGTTAAPTNIPTITFVICFPCYFLIWVVMLGCCGASVNPAIPITHKAVFITTTTSAFFAGWGNFPC